LSPVGDHILQKFNTPYLTRFTCKTCQIARPPQTIAYIGGSRKVPLHVIFVRRRHFALLYVSQIFLRIVCSVEAGNESFKAVRVKVLAAVSLAVLLANFAHKKWKNKNMNNLMQRLSFIVLVSLIRNSSRFR
jgi:hypothetical protein